MKKKVKNVKELIYLGYVMTRNNGSLYKALGEAIKSNFREGMGQVERRLAQKTRFRCWLEK